MQRRLADHLSGGGALLLIGRLPQRDTENARCTVLADALALQSGDLVRGSHLYYPSVSGHGVAGWLPETRVGWLAPLFGPAATPLLTDVDGRTCAVSVTAGSGRAVVITAELPAHPELFVALLGLLGCQPGLRLRTTVPGVVVTTGITSRGERMLHVLNPTPYAATVQVEAGDPSGLLDRPLLVPARTGRMLGLGLELPGGGIDRGQQRRSRRGNR